MKRIILRSLCFVLLVALISSLAATVALAASEQGSILNGVKVGFYGDSICAAGRENRIGWAGRIGDKNQMIWDNNAQGGWAVSNCRGDTETIYYQLWSTRYSLYDMVILHGGTNDAWSNAPIGNISEDFLPSSSYSQDTFAGGLEKIFAYLRERRPNAIVGYIINFKFINASDGATTEIDGNTVYVLNNMQEYVDMTKKICEKWEIPYLDLYSDDKLTSKLHPIDVTGRYAKTYLRDFIHPTSEGYDLLTPYIENFMIDLATASRVIEKQTKEYPVYTPEENSTNDTIVQNTTTDQISNAKSSCGAMISSTAVISIGAILIGGIFICRRKHSE